MARKLPKPSAGSLWGQTMTKSGKWISHKAVQHILEEHPEPFILALERGELEVELYEPRGEDDQTPHTRDEVYIVVKGSGDFMCSGETKPFVVGDVLFVPAHADHRFLDFTDNLSVW